MRWRVKDTIRFIKQSYKLEHVRCLDYQRLKNVAALVVAVACMTGATRADIDAGQAYVCTMKARDLMERSVAPAPPEFRDKGRLPVVGVSDQHLSADANMTENCYAEALVKAGFAPLLIPCTTNAAALEAALARVDLLVLTGGADVEPSRYRAARSPKCGEADRLRDEYEFMLVAAARRRRLPIVGICRGCQLLNAAFGGTLWQDLPSEFTNRVPRVRHGAGSYLHPADHPVAHTVSVVPGSRLAAAIGGGDLAVNSHHHQAVKDLAPGFSAAAYAPDGVIEAIESRDYPAVGVQFHPESLVARAEGHPGYDIVRLLRLLRAYR